MTKLLCPICGSIVEYEPIDICFFCTSSTCTFNADGCDDEDSYFMYFAQIMDDEEESIVKPVCEFAGDEIECSCCASCDDCEDKTDFTFDEGDCNEPIDCDIRHYPCDNMGECPHGAFGGYDCRNNCGLGV